MENKGQGLAESDVANILTQSHLSASLALCASSVPHVIYNFGTGSVMLTVRKLKVINAHLKVKGHVYISLHVTG